MVLADANVLYSRVLRDYLLYAADQEVLSIAWSADILGEVTENLIANRADFTIDSARRLVNAMNNAFPLADARRPADGDDRGAPRRHARRAQADSLGACSRNARNNA